MTGPVLRAARPGDAAAVADIARAAYAKYVPRIGRAPAPMRADFPAAIAAGTVQVIEEEGRIVAYIVAEARADHVFVENVGVAPERQGQGLGARLMAFAEAEAGRLGLAELRLYTNVAMTENFAFYRRLGFVETGRRREDGFDRVYMAKRLG